MKNPYLIRTPVTNPQAFFGRSFELETICTGVQDDPPQSFAVIGDRRIGKSSVVHQVLGRHARDELQTPLPTVMLFHDFQAHCPAGPAESRAFVAGEVGRALDLPPAQLGDGSSMVSLGELLRARGQRVVFVWDEFEVALRRGATDGKLLEELRSLASSGTAAFLTATLRDPQSMCLSRDLAGSSFFNVFHRVTLGPLDRDAALALVGCPSAAAGVPLEPWADQLIELAGTFPILLQTACGACFELLRRVPPGTAPDWDEVQDRFAQRADADFRYVLSNGLTRDEVEVCRCLAEERAIDTSLRRALRSLVRRGYVARRGGGHALFSPCFVEAVLDHEAEAEPGPEPGPDAFEETENVDTVKRFCDAVSSCNEVAGYYGLPFVFGSAPDSYRIVQKLLCCPTSELELQSLVVELWKVAYEETHTTKGARSGSTSRIAETFRKMYYRSRPLQALIALRNFYFHSKMQTKPDEPSWRYNNAGEVYGEYLPGARRHLASPEDYGIVFDGLLQDVCLQIETLTSAMRAAGERGELEKTKDS